MAKKIPIVTNAAPPSIGTHTQAIRVGDLVFTTGQTGRDPGTGILAEGVEAQTHQMLANVEAILNENSPLTLLAGKRKYTMKPADMTHYQGDRGRRGNKLPRGFQRVNGIISDKPNNSTSKEVFVYD